MNNHEEKIIPILNLENIKVLSPLGRGAKGVVFLVKEEESGELSALKVILRDLVEKMNKDLANNRNEYKRVYFEQQVLSRLNHPLLPKLRGVLGTDKIVAYAIDYCSGRDLNFLRKQQSEKMFSIDTIRFYAAELVLALEYLHNLGIAYRDLKPENIMIQENGHIMLVDFDLSTKLSAKPRQNALIPDSDEKIKPVRKKQRSPLHRFCNKGVSPYDSADLRNHSAPPESDPTEKSNSFVGTEEYVAPEIINAYGHEFAADWWSLGVVLYEMLYGVTPFKGENRKETFYRILVKTPGLVGEATPLRDLIGKLLIKDPKERIKVEGIKDHGFFKGVNWDLLLQISRPPYIPVVESGNVEGKDIDVELFVQGIFASDEGEKNEKFDDEKTKKHENHEENINEKAWVNGLDNHPCEAENFLVF